MGSRRRRGWGVAPAAVVERPGGSQTTLVAHPQRAPEGPDREPGWRYRELATGHDAMLTAPHELAVLLTAP